MINKIINIANIDPSEKAGGLNLMVKNIVNAQIKEGIDAKLLYFNIPNYNLENSNKNIKYKNLISFCKLVTKDTHFIFHSIYNIKYIFLILIIILLGGNYSIHSHGSLSKHSIKKSWVKRYCYIIAVKFMLIFSKKIIFSNHSEFLNSIIKNEKKIFFIPNLIPATSNIQLEEQKDIKKIIYIGKIDYYYKGIDNLIIALSEFLDKNEDYTVDIYGFGNNKNLDINNIDHKEKDIKKLLLDIKKYNLENKVNFLGPITGIKKTIALKKAGVFILTSNSEAMPLSISEALCNSIPVIATKQTNMSEYIIPYNAGVICENNSVDILNALDTYHNNIVCNYNYYSQNAFNCYQSELNSIYLNAYISRYIKELK